MSDQEWVGKLVKFKSGRFGIVLSVQNESGSTFLNVHVSGLGVINIRAEDVEKVK